MPQKQVIVSSHGRSEGAAQHFTIVVQEPKDPTLAAAARNSQLLAVGGLLLNLVGLLMVVLTFLTNRRSNERQVRAYVNVDGVVLETMEVGKPVDARIEHANLGQTPATEVRVDGELVVAEHDYRAGTIEVSTTGSAAVLGAGQARSVHCLTATPLTDKNLEDLKAGRAFLILTGIITYCDAFGRARFTGFTQRGRDGGPVQGDTLQVRPHGNYMR